MSGLSKLGKASRHKPGTRGSAVVELRRAGENIGLFIMYNWEHEKHYYEASATKYVPRTGLEDGFKIVGVTGNPLGCIGCPQLEHH